MLRVGFYGFNTKELQRSRITLFFELFHNNRLQFQGPPLQAENYITGFLFQITGSTSLKYFSRGYLVP
eukprot:TRINITY_DN9401_c0_g1_i1.p3 TRINITY_DN9401_c0_g1~~TRINITY_DN9401_c0_g1_i1.p3  ORF type:complete len:68 (-),score=8.70 TRINITY_DN9401_c0_g1_i1:894-1097(-)